MSEVVRRSRRKLSAEAVGSSRRKQKQSEAVRSRGKQSEAVGGTGEHATDLGLQVKKKQRTCMTTGKHGPTMKESNSDLYWATY